MTDEEKQREDRVTKALKKIIECESRVPEIAEMAGALVSVFGGAESFAREYYQQYQKIKGSPMATSKMLDGILRIINLAGAKPKNNDIQDMSDEDLKAVVRKLLTEPNA